MILVVDPGKSAIGWCLIDDRRLVGCGFHSFENHFALAGWLRARGTYERVVCEMPQSAVKSMHSMAIQNDVLDVAVTVGVIASLAPASLIHPSTWKGRADKKIHQPRVLEDLARRPEGRTILAQLDELPKTIRHNTVDAIGIALWYLDRTGRVVP